MKYIKLLLMNNQQDQQQYQTDPGLLSFDEEEGAVRNHKTLRPFSAAPINLSEDED
jgi:hypothetical protein